MASVASVAPVPPAGVPAPQPQPQPQAPSIPSVISMGSHAPVVLPLVRPLSAQLASDIASGRMPLASASSSSGPPPPPPPQAPQPSGGTASAFISRDPSFSFDHAWNRYASIRGKSFLNPKPHETVPKLHDREATFAKYARADKFIFYLTELLQLRDDLYLTGQCTNGASVSLKLLNLRPFFFISTPSDRTTPAELKAYAVELKEQLNDRENWPKHFWGGGKDRMPVTDVVLETRTAGVCYRGVVPGTDIRKQQYVYRLDFWNLSAWRHYRSGLAREKCGLDYKPTLYHEQDFFTYAQSLFNRVYGMTYGSWIETNSNKVKWIPTDAPDSFGGHSDTEWTEDALNRLEEDAEMEYGASSSSDSSSETEKTGSKRKREDGEGESRAADDVSRGRKKWDKRKRKANAQVRRRTRSVLEGSIDYRELKPRPDIDGASPLVLQIFDIETASGKVVRYHLQGKRKPPLPQDEILPEGARHLPLDAEEIYRDLLDRIKDGGDEENKTSSSSSSTANPSATSDDRQSSILSFLSHYDRTKKLGRKTSDASPQAQTGAGSSGELGRKRKASERGAGHEEPYKAIHLFPDPNNAADPIVLISTEFWIYGDDKPFLKVLHSLRPASERPELDDTVKFRWDGPTVANEHAMLSHWCHMLCSQMDLEWLVTYNGIGYDLPYMFVRSLFLKCRRFVRMGRFLALPDEEYTDENRFKQCLLKAVPKMGKPLKRKNGEFDFPGIKVQIPGVLQLDVMVIIKGMHKFETYSLKEVAKKLLEDQRKRELKAVLITPSWCTDDFFRSLLEYYGMEDSHTTGTVAFKNQMVPHVTELMSLTRTSANDLTFRGQQKKTWNQFVYTAHHEGWLLDEPARQFMQGKYGVPCDPVMGYLKTPEEKQAEMQKKMNMTRAEKSKHRLKYTGGFVLTPEAEYHTDECATLDFNSLYPTVIIAHNLCWSTWVEHEYDDQGRIWFPLYGPSYETQDRSRYMIWNLSDLRPTAEQAAGRDIIMVVEDWGCVEAARWTAYQQWLKLRAVKAANPPFKPEPMPPELPPVPEWRPQPGQVPRMTCCFVVNRRSIFPPILNKLLTQRSAVKKLMKAAKEAKDKFMEGVYDARQLALKLSANAGYGFTGAVDGFFGGVAIGATTCLLGRHYAILAALTAEREGWGPSLYGDSVPYNTPIQITSLPRKAVPHQTDVEHMVHSVNHIPIQELVPQHVVDAAQPTEHGKTIINVESQNLYTKTHMGWTRIRKWIRHKTDKQLYTVRTRNGSAVTVTQDHSLIGADGQEIRPRELRPGHSRLMLSKIDASRDGPTTPTGVGMSEEDAWVAGSLYRRPLNQQSAVRRERYRVLREAGRMMDTTTNGCTTVDEMNMMKDIMGQQPTTRQSSSASCPRSMSHTRQLLRKWRDLTTIPAKVRQSDNPYVRQSFIDGYCGRPFKRTGDGHNPWILGEDVQRTDHDRHPWDPQCVRAAEVLQLQLESQSASGDLDGDIVDSVTPHNHVQEEEYVYDLETDAGCFTAGAGNIVCHNTDSIFVRFPFLQERYENDEKARRSAIKKQAVYIADFISSRCPNPMKIEVEKLILRMALYRKKMYGYCTEEWDDKKKVLVNKISTRGLSSVRRDYALLIRKAHQDTLQLLLTVPPRVIRAAQVTKLGDPEDPQLGTKRKRQGRKKAGGPKDKGQMSLKRVAVPGGDGTRPSPLLQPLHDVVEQEEEGEDGGDPDVTAVSAPVPPATVPPPEAVRLDQVFAQDEAEAESDKRDERRRSERRKELERRTANITAEETDAACATLLAPLKVAMDRITFARLDYEEMQRTAAKGESYSNDKLMQVQAIMRAEARRGSKFDVGQRIGFLVVRPKVLPRVREVGGMVAYDMSKQYANAEETSYAEENDLPIHRMYYVAQLRAKIEQTLSLVMSKERIARFLKPYVRRIYQTDFGLADITDVFEKLDKPDVLPEAASADDEEDPSRNDADADDEDEEDDDMIVSDDE